MKDVEKKGLIYRYQSPELRRQEAEQKTVNAGTFKNMFLLFLRCEAVFKCYKEPWKKEWRVASLTQRVGRPHPSLSVSRAVGQH